MDTVPVLLLLEIFVGTLVMVALFMFFARDAAPTPLVSRLLHDVDPPARPRR